jgi:ABC-2 type transport system ATP-binding protein
VLDAIGLTKRYGAIQALDGLTLHVGDGEIVGLVGHNGAGKTTLVSILAGLNKPDGGTVHVDGTDPVRARDRIGIAPPHIALYQSITVREHLRLFGGLAGLRGRALAAVITELVEALRLTEFVDRRAGLLSGGQQRRAQAAVALVHRPRLLLLDEPTAGADPETRQALLDVVKDRARDGASIIYTTHYLPELTELRATIAVAQQGRIIARGTSAELLDRLAGEVLLRFDVGEYRTATHDPSATLVDLVSRARYPIRGVELRTPTLDDLYRSLAAADVH